VTPRTSYQPWRATLDQWLADQRTQAPIVEAPGDPVARQIVTLVTEARRVVGAINATAEGIEVTDKNKYDFVLSMLGRIITFDEFVLAEYPYELSPQRRPGVRVLLESSSAGRRIVLVFFEDTRFWRVDWQERRVAYELVSFELGEPEPVAKVADESAEYFAADWSWREHLREGLCLPFRLLPPD